MLCWLRCVQGDVMETSVCTHCWHALGDWLDNTMTVLLWKVIDTHTHTPLHYVCNSFLYMFKSATISLRSGLALVCFHMDKHGRMRENLKFEQIFWMTLEIWGLGQALRCIYTTVLTLTENRICTVALSLLLRCHFIIFFLWHGRTLRDCLSLN